MMGWRRLAIEPPRHWIARTMRPLAPAARPVSSTGTRWDRTSTPEACGTHAGLLLQRSGGCRVDGRRCGRESDDRETGATDTQPSQSYYGMLNKSRLCFRLPLLRRSVWSAPGGVCTLVEAIGYSHADRLSQARHAQRSFASERYSPFAWRRLFCQRHSDLPAVLAIPNALRHLRCNRAQGRYHGTKVDRVRGHYNCAELRVGRGETGLWTGHQRTGSTRAR